ncbi:MAG: 30S ribosomal protein S3 [Nitrospiraceae bacterium]|nr:30S ribosomal protein S3 [Nitrospiraceae bacterium]
MGQKVHPYGFRLGVTKDWVSKWYASKKNYSQFVLEDFAIRNEIKKLGPSAAVSHVEIVRKGSIAAGEVTVILHSARPGMIIGKRGADIAKLQEGLKQVLISSTENLRVEVKEIRRPEIDAELVAQNVIGKLEQKISHKRAIKQAIGRAMRAGAKGIKIQVSGRLGGAEIARTEWYRDGRVPLQTINADIDYAEEPALIKFGRIGVKVWVYKGDAKKSTFFTLEK